MTAPQQWLRPADAAKQFSVSERTLSRWATAGLIGHSKPADGRLVLYAASDIADVIERGVTPRTVVPIQSQPTMAAADDDWRSDPLWAGRFR